MKALRFFFASAALVCAGQATAQQQATTYRLNFFHEAATAAEAQLAVEAVEAVVGERGRTQKQVGLFPEDPPAVPGNPAYKAINVGAFSQQLLQCSGAFAQIGFSKDTGANALGGSGERYTGCVFVSKAGIRSSIVIERYTRAGGSLLGGIIGGIRNAMQGDDAEWGDKTVARFTEIYKQRMPNALVELVETPKGIERPDDARVKELLSRSKQAEIPTATSTTNGSSVVTSSLSASLGEAVEARKLLTSMGLTYHSADQFEEALKRRDMPAVELFVKAAGLRADTRSSTGRTAAEVAQQIGDQVLSDWVRKLK